MPGDRPHQMFELFFFPGTEVGTSVTHTNSHVGIRRAIMTMTRVSTIDVAPSIINQ